MNKKNIIKKAWGKNWNKVKGLINEDGSVLSFRNIMKQNPTKEEIEEGLFWKILGYKREDIFEIYDDMGPSRWYPKELEGIEDNNGWISVFGGMPRESSGLYYVYDGKAVVIARMSILQFRTLGSNEVYSDVTHYQKINKPNPPIY